METSYRTTQLAEATRMADLARAVMNSKKVGSWAWLDAADDVEFWTNKTAVLANTR